MPGLLTDDVARLMTIVSGTEPAPDVALRVRERTGGNPLFVAELARLAGSGGVAADDVVPDAVRDVVRRRLAQLPPVTTDVLAAAAVLGEDIDLHVLAEASGDTLDDALDALDPAIVTRVLVPDDAGAYRFAHALVRDAVLVELSPLRLARMHRRAADAIEAMYGADFDHAEPIAWHRLAALSVDDPARVAHALTLAGDVARVRSFYDRSEELLERALEIALRVPPGPQRVAIEVSAMESLLSLETVRTFMGRGLVEMADRIDAVADRNESTAMRQLATFTRWSQINALGPAATEEDARRALAVAEESDDLYSVVMGEYVAAAQAFLAGRNEAAREHFARSMEGEDRAAAHDPPIRTALPTVAGMAAMAEQLAGEPARADALLERLRRSLARRRDGGVEVDFEFFHCLVLAMRGDATGTAAGSAFTIEAVPRSWMPHFSPACRILHVWARVLLGTGAPLLGIAREALQELEDGPTSIGLPAFRTFFAEALLHLDDPTALEELRRADAAGRGSGDAWWQAETLRLLAAAEAAYGEPDAAARLLDDSARAAAAQGAHLLVARIEASRARLAS
jgi:tetratricopeptide (TPR) repeat protein